MLNNLVSLNKIIIQLYVASNFVFNKDFIYLHSFLSFTVNKETFTTSSSIYREVAILIVGSRLLLNPNGSPHTKNQE